MGPMNHWGGRTVRRSRMAGPAVLAASVLLMAGCTAVGTMWAEPPTLTPGPVLSVAPNAVAQEAPGGRPAGPANPVPVPQAAAETAATVQDALDALAGESRRPSTEQVSNALAAAGFTGPGVEVTHTRTPTGLEADAVEAAVLEGGDCVMGHIRDGSVTVTVLPVLASGRCFVGSVVQ